ncbi:transposase [Nonomuraea longispora]|uniref:Transposase n=1 Tax=Nonomuraea longispora TaxID=1848320 RepID=A0A4R4NQ33_9ACTN|nr:transposase [Nonomuraea longispora]TDC09242.1 transposase [Nonomuraea longispora]
MRRGDLTNAEWERLAPLLPPEELLPPDDSRRGRPRTGHRAAINGMLYQARTGEHWRDLPQRFGCWVAIYKRHRRWAADGTWQQLLSAIEVVQGTCAQTPSGASSRRPKLRAVPPPAPRRRRATPSHPALARLRDHLAEVVSRRTV